jgi:hypothetical protein
MMVSFINTSPWLRIVLVVAIVWLGVSLVHGVRFALTRTSGDGLKVSEPQR